jgi:hypothetical protein
MLRTALRRFTGPIVLYLFQKFAERQLTMPANQWIWPLLPYVAAVWAIMGALAYWDAGWAFVFGPASRRPIETPQQRSARWETAKRRFSEIDGELTANCRLHQGRRRIEWSVNESGPGSNVFRRREQFIAAAAAAGLLLPSEGYGTVQGGVDAADDWLNALAVESHQGHSFKMAGTEFGESVQPIFLEDVVLASRTLCDRFANGLVQPPK